MIEIEIWKIVNEFPHLQVSNTGKCRSNAKGEWKEMKLSPHPEGHYRVNINKDGINTTRYIHKLVALAFIENTNKMRRYVTHIDFNYANNHINNLKWITQAELMIIQSIYGTRDNIKTWKTRKAIYGTNGSSKSNWGVGPWKNGSRKIKVDRDEFAKMKVNHSQKELREFFKLSKSYCYKLYNKN